MPKFKEITLQQTTHVLSGTLTIPDNSNDQMPAILLVSGAGFCDRDGNVGSIKLNTLRLLSEYFTQCGFVTLRYDKRGVGKSTGDYYASGLNDCIQDAVAMTRFLKTVDKVDPNRILLLGHSEGAYLAPAVYQKEKVHALMLLCGTASPGSEIMPLPGKKLVTEIQNTTGIKGFMFKLFRLDKIAKKIWDGINNKALQTDASVIKIFCIKKFNGKWLR